MLTEEQMQLRCGKLCASSINKIMGAKGFGKTGESYLWQLIAERETGKTTHIPTNFAMEWGNDHEEEAGYYYAQAKGIEIKEGESISLGELIATPDFVCIDGEFGIEIKCPYNSANHAQRLRYKDYTDIKSNNPDYYWQMVAGMLVTGFKKWVFISYDPRFKEPSKKMIAITVPYVKSDMDLLIERISKAVGFMVENGVDGLDHKHADFYGFLKMHEYEENHNHLHDVESC